MKRTELGLMNLPLITVLCLKNCNLDRGTGWTDSLETICTNGLNWHPLTSCSVIGRQNVRGQGRWVAAWRLDCISVVGRTETIEQIEVSEYRSRERREIRWGERSRCHVVK